MIYIKWFLLSLVNLSLINISYLITPVVSLFTSDGWPKFGDWFYTGVTPPKGSRKYIADEAPFIPGNTPFQRYVNRAWWLYRHPCHGFKQDVGVGWGPNLIFKTFMCHHPVCYYREVWDEFGKPLAFELKVGKIRLGWDLDTDRFKSDGVAPFIL